MVDFLTLRSADEILGLIGLFEPLESEPAPLEDALGRVLSRPFLAPEDLPGFRRSAMDGFAVRAAGVFGASEGAPALLDLVGECPMGAPADLAVGPGQAARIWTGGMLPDGADAVVMLEHSRPAGEGRVELTRPAAPLENVVAADEDAGRGEELIPAGRRLRPQELGLLAAFGLDAIGVRRRPRVAVISSGEELAAPGEAPRPGQVRDMNSIMLSALVRSAGAEARCLGIVRDDVEEIGDAVAACLGWADVVLLSGGSSAGRRDCAARALASLEGAELLVHGAAISPGKPLILVRLGAKSLWGLPGHPASALVCAEVFIKPLLGVLSGLERRPGPLPKARLSRPVASAQGRRDYIRVALGPPEVPGGPCAAIPIVGKSALITTLVRAGALVACPEDLEGLEEGLMADLLPCP